MNDIYCVRADSGRFTKDFINGGYVGIGFLPDYDLSQITCYDKLNDILPDIYKKMYPDEKSPVITGQQVGQIARFLKIEEGDYVITPDYDTESIYYGIIEKKSYYYCAPDNCRYRHRKRVRWCKTPISRMIFSIPFQNSIRSLLTVFAIKHKTEFFDKIGKQGLAGKEEKITFDYYSSVLASIKNLDSKEFELLILNILSAIGFDNVEHTGKPGDGGVDVKGKLNMSGLASVNLYVQAKQLDPNGSVVKTKDVKALRANIPHDGQGAFITTANFQKDAEKVALASGFQRIGLINGRQLVDILVQYWDDIDDVFKNKLNLKVGLVPN